MKLPLQIVKQQIRIIKTSPQIRVLLSALGSAFMWFCWAYWANHEHTAHQALVSGLSQGGVSFTTTFVGTFLLEVLYVRLGATAAGRISSAAVVSGLSLGFMVTVHTLAHTPNMVMTILPVFTVVVIYCGSYIYGLHKIKTLNESDAVEVVSS